MSADPTPGPRLLAGLGAPLITRADWGAAPSSGWPVVHHEVRGIVVHHTATTNDDRDPLAMVRRVQHFHAVERGWGDIGYSFVVLPDGRIVEGREGSASALAPLGVVAGHVYGHNAGTLGIAVAGRFHDEPPSDDALDSLVDLIATVCRTCALDPAGGPVALANGAEISAVVSGHRHAGATSCPGDALVAALPTLRRLAASRLATPRVANAMRQQEAHEPVADERARHRPTSAASGPDAAQYAG